MTSDPGLYVTVVHCPANRTPLYMNFKYEIRDDLIFLNEPVREKTNNLGFRPGLTQTGLYSHRTLLEAGNFVFK